MDTKIQKLNEELEKTKKEIDDNFKGAELFNCVMNTTKTNKENKERQKLFDKLCKKYDSIEAKIEKLKNK